MKKTVIKNGRVVTLTDVYEDGFVVIEDGVITDFGSGVPEEKGADEVIDAKGCYVTPGFIDIHLHGGGDSDFMDGTAEALSWRLRRTPNTGRRRCSPPPFRATRTNFARHSNSMTMRLR